MLSARSIKACPPEKKEALSGVASDISALPIEKLRVFDQLLSFLETHVNRYPEVVDELVRNEAVDEGDMPPEYNAPIFATIHVMVREAIKRASSSAPKFARGGIASIKDSAKWVQNAGRGEDKILAHITPAEADLLKSRGGSGDINPKTGLPEYGFLKSIGKLFGAVAPIIGTVVGGMFGMPFLGAVIGGGLGGLASGGGVKGALMGAGMAAVSSLAFGGISSAMGSGTFMEGVTNTLPSYLGGSGESFGGTLFGSGASGSTSMGETPLPPTRPESFGPSTSPDTNLSQAELTANAVRNGTPNDVVKATVNPNAAPGKDVSFLDDPMAWIKDHKGTALLLGGGALLAASKMNEKKAPASLAASHPDLTQAQRQEQYPWTTVDASKFKVNTTSPSVTAATTPSSEYNWQQGVYKSPSFPQVGTQNTVQMGAQNTSPPPLGNNRQDTYPWMGANYTPQFAQAATGGIMDARTGGHLKGPGSGTSDSIPAKLSDGEFVMTAKAVRGAGGGDRMKGAKKMYELMHKFERVA